VADDWVWATHPEHGSTGLIGTVWSFDLETNARDNRDPFRHAYMCGVNCGFAPHQIYRDPESLARLAWTLENAALRGVRVVGHNCSRFDRTVLRGLYGNHVRCDDTILLGFLFHETWGMDKRLNLQSLATADLGVEPWKDDVTWDWKDPKSIPEYESGAYNARDIVHTRNLFLKYAADAQADGYLWRVYDKLLLPTSRALADMEERGVYINTKNCDEATDIFTREAADHMDTIQMVAHAHGLEKFNPASPDQVAVLLFDKLQLPVIEKTAGGKRSTAVGPIKKLRTMGAAPDLLNAILKRRKAMRVVNTYSDKIRRAVDWQSMIYPSYSMVNTDSGRTASFGPYGNMQNIPRDKRVRRIVGAPPGKVLLSADFSQLEMRTGASKYVFDEPTMRAAFERGDDPHRLLGSFITGKPPELVTSKERTDAKRANFLFLYGGEEPMYIDKLLEDFDIVKSYEDAKHERDAFFHRWPALPAGHIRIIETVKRDLQIRSPLGTLRRLPEAGTQYQRGIRTHAFRVAINFVNQCFAFHLAAIGLVLLNAAGLDVRSFQHDAYLIYVDDNEAAVREAAQKIRYLLERGVVDVLLREFELEFDVPLKVDITAGTAWTEDDRLCEHGIWMPKIACETCAPADVAHWAGLDKLQQAAV
jgi:DNA polymerase I